MMNSFLIIGIVVIPKLSSFYVLFLAEEMDWDRNGMVNFKEFLFAFIYWVGIEDIDDDDEDEG